MDEEGHGEDEVTGIAILHEFPIEICLHVRIRRINVRGNARSAGTESIKSLGPGELAWKIRECPFGHVVKAGIAQYMFQGFRLRNILDRILDHHRQLSFVTYIFPHPGIDDRIIGADEASQWLDEMGGKFREGPAELLDMGPVIQAHA